MTLGDVDIHNPLITSITLIILIGLFFVTYYFVFRRTKYSSEYDELYRQLRDKKFAVVILIHLVLFYIMGVILASQILKVDLSFKEPVITSKNQDLAFIIDGSYSMHAKDIAQGDTRFEMAKSLVSELVDTTVNNNASANVFSGKSYNYIPNNPDKTSTLKMISDLDISKLQNNPDWISGSALGDSILHAGSQYEDQVSKPLLIIISDGGVTDGISPEQAINFTRDSFTDVYYISIGSQKSSYAYIPTGSFNIGQKILIGGRDDSLGDVFGDTYYIFDKRSFIDDFVHDIQKQKTYSHNIQNTDTDSRAIILVALSICLFLILFTVFDGYIGKFKYMYIGSLLVLCLLSMMLFMNKNSDKISHAYYITNNAEKQMLVEYLQKSDSEKSDLVIGFRDREGKKKIAFPEGVTKDIAVNELDKIPVDSSNNQVTQYAGFTDNRYDFERIIGLLLGIAWIGSLVLFIKRYSGKK